MTKATIFERTAEQLSWLSASHEACLVAFSTGKDSLVVMDMACRVFKRVMPYFMYLVPDLAVIEHRIADAEKRWGCEVFQVPHWCLGADMSNGVYCPRRPGFDGASRKLKGPDIIAYMRRETGIALCLTGDKKQDFLARRGWITSNKDADLAFPLADWTSLEVLAYLVTRGIPVPEAPYDNFGIDLSTRSLLWLHDNHPDDFRLLCGDFPFAPAVVVRRRFYGQA